MSQKVSRLAEVERAKYNTVKWKQAPRIADDAHEACDLTEASGEELKTSGLSGAMRRP